MAGPYPRIKHYGPAATLKRIVAAEKRQAASATLAPKQGRPPLAAARERLPDGRRKLPMYADLAQRAVYAVRYVGERDWTDVVAEQRDALVAAILDSTVPEEALTQVIGRLLAACVPYEVVARQAAAKAEREVAAKAAARAAAEEARRVKLDRNRAFDREYDYAMVRATAPAPDAGADAEAEAETNPTATEETTS